MRPTYSITTGCPAVISLSPRLYNKVTVFRDQDPNSKGRLAAAEVLYAGVALGAGAEFALRGLLSILTVPAFILSKIIPEDYRPEIFEIAAMITGIGTLVSIATVFRALQALVINLNPRGEIVPMGDKRYNHRENLLTNRHLSGMDVGALYEDSDNEGLNYLGFSHLNKKQRSTRNLT